MMDLPVHDDLELVLQASKLTAAAEPTAVAAPVTTQLRPMPRAAAAASGQSSYQYAQENSVVNLDAAYGGTEGQDGNEISIRPGRVPEGRDRTHGGRRERVRCGAHVRRCAVA